MGQSVATGEDVVLPVTLAASDPDGDTLTYTLLTPPQHGSLSGTPPVLSYRPGANYNGSDSFSFQVSDGSITSAPAVVAITVVAVNDAPVTDSREIAATEDIQTEITLTASDVEGNSVTFIVTAGPEHGTLSGTAPNLTYTPAPDYFGQDSFSFQASDGMADSLPATITLLVAPVNDAPTAIAQIVLADNATSLPIALAGSDVETAADNLTFAVVTPPAYGTLSGTPPSLVYTPNPAYRGPDSFTFTVTDRGDLDDCATAGETCPEVETSPLGTVSIDVTDGTAPETVLTFYPATLSNDRNPVFGFLGSDNVTVSDDLAFECSLDFGDFLPCGSLGNPTTSYTGLPDGQHTFQVGAKDQADNQDNTSASYTWTIDATPPGTVIESQPPMFASSPSAAFTFRSTEADSNLSCSIDGGAPVDCSSGSKTYDGLADGNHTFTVAARDQAGNEDPVAASYSWIVDTTAPQTSIDNSPSDSTTSTTATFTFHGGDPGGNSTFECSLDGASFTSCTSPITYSDLAPGPHTFEVLGIDSVGNRDETPETFIWTIGQVMLDQYTLDADFRRFDGFDVVFGKFSGASLWMTGTNPNTFHYQIKLTNETGSQIGPDNGNTATAIITVPGMPASCGGVECSQNMGAMADPAFELKGRKIVRLWPGHDRDNDDDVDAPVTVQYMTLAQYQANGDSCADNPNYSSTLPLNGAPKCIKVSGFTIPVKHAARIRLAFQFRPIGTNGWDPDARQLFHAGFPFRAASFVTFNSNTQNTADTTGLVGAGNKATAIGGFVFAAAGAPLNEPVVRLFAKADLASCTQNTHLIAQDAVDENGFYYIWRTGLNQDDPRAPSLPTGVRYAVQVCDGPNQVALRLTENKLHEKEFEQVDFDQ
jgi:hypothetical protein